MSLFKKITSFLFEESEEDVIVEDELTNVYMKELNEEAYMTEEIKLPKVEENRTVFDQQPPTESSKFVSINLHEEAQQPIKKDYDQFQKPIRVKTIKHEERKEYEFSPVISPMFGADEEEVKREKIKKVVTPTPTVSRKYKKKENSFETIISPYFGVDDYEERVEEKKDVVEQIAIEETKQEVIEEVVGVVEDTHTFMDVAEKQDIVEEETTSFSLEDMLLSKGKREIKEETLQISIFGNHSPVKEENESES